MQQITGPEAFPWGTYTRFGPVIVAVDKSYSRREASEFALEVSAIPIIERKKLAIVNFPGGPMIDTPKGVRVYNLPDGFDMELLDSIVDDFIGWRE